MSRRPVKRLLTQSPVFSLRDKIVGALARAQARAGQPTLIAGYLGRGDQFDEAVADFATAYAEQNERDYKALVRAAQQGRIEVYTKKLRTCYEDTQKE